MKNLAPLFNPRSIAIVGCSPITSDKLGSWPLKNLLIQKSPVTIYPVNPRRSEIEGLKCYADLDALPEVPDLVLVMVPASSALEVLRIADRLGAGAVIVFGSGFGETAEGKDLEAELTAFCAASQMPVCGPNTDGVVNIVDRIPAGFPPFAARTDVPVGPIAVISQSGALVSSLVSQLIRNGLGLSFSCAIGNAIDLGVGDYLAHFAAVESIETVLIYIEGLTDADSFVAGARTAIDAGKTVMVFKSGRSPEGAVAAASHTGSLVGSYDAFQALCTHNGIVTVDSLQELAALPALVPVARRFGPNSGAGIISGSGAVAGIMTDAARAHDVSVPPLEDTTVSSLGSRLTFGLPQNPLDLTGQVVHDPDLHLDALRAFSSDGAVDLIVASSLAGPPEITDRMKRELVSNATGDVPVIVYSADGNDAIDEPILLEGGVPVFPSLGLLFGGLSKLAKRVDGETVESGLDDRRTRARSLVDGLEPGPVPVDVAWDLLELYEIPVARERIVSSESAATSAADGAGYPVVLKLSGPDVLHKSDQGLVHLNRSDRNSVSESYRQLAAVKDSTYPTAVVTVQPMIDAGVEAIVGGVVDREAGPMILAGVGGVLTELISDTSLAPAPVSTGGAQRLIGATKLGALLAGPRGRPPADAPALGSIVVALSSLVADLAELIEEIEMNPVIVRTAGARAVDVLLTRRGAAGDPT